MGDVPVSVITKDNRKITVQGSVLLRLDVHQIPAIWQTIGEDFVAKIVRPTIRSRVRMVLAQYTNQDIIADKRDNIEQELKSELERIFYPRGIYVENVLLSEVGGGAKE
ncbi:MAG: HflC/HflK family protein [Candidatus Magasanikbacteria bacterium GW2011_GWA2_41_55]|nr:MAG: HflC/HflK family protein [Candidatus Magasanikbacteria bacterium GW2011_GWA2_41_55]